MESLSTVDLVFFNSSSNLDTISTHFLHILGVNLGVTPVTHVSVCTYYVHIIFLAVLGFELRALHWLCNLNDTPCKPKHS
jgi:hypothetical protein